MWSVCGPRKNRDDRAMYTYYPSQPREVSNIIFSFKKIQRIFEFPPLNFQRFRRYLWCFCDVQSRDIGQYSFFSIYSYCCYLKSQLPRGVIENLIQKVSNVDFCILWVYVTHTWKSGFSCCMFVFLKYIMVFNII